MIKSCTCKHEYQDKKYGKGKRVFNKMDKQIGPGNHYYKCTVCERIITK